MSKDLNEIRGFSRVQAAGKFLGRHTAETPKDIKTMYRAHRMLSRTRRKGDRTWGRPATTVRLAQNLSFANQALSTAKLPIQYKGGAKRVHAAAKQGVARHAAVGRRLGVQRSAAATRLAKRAFVGAAAVGSLAVGRQAYRWMKRRADEKARFSSIDVHPGHQYAAVRGERYNRPVYYDPDEVGAGPPRVHEATTSLTPRREKYAAYVAKLAQEDLISRVVDDLLQD